MDRKRLRVRCAASRTRVHNGDGSRASSGDEWGRHRGGQLRGRNKRRGERGGAPTNRRSGNEVRAGDRQGELRAACGGASWVNRRGGRCRVIDNKCHRVRCSTARRRVYYGGRG